MNDRILYRSKGLTEASSEIKKVIEALERITSDLGRVDTSDGWWSRLNVRTPQGRSSARSALNMIKSTNNKAIDYMEDIVSGIGKAKALFEDAEGAVKADGNSMFSGNVYDNEGGSHSGSSGNTHGGSGKAFGGTPWNEYSNGVEFFKEIYTHVTNGAIELAELFKVGKAKDVKGTLAAWFKKGLALEKFDLKKSFSETFGNLAGKNGAIKTAVEWGGIALDGLGNLFGNLNERAESGGQMSSGRVVAETITETAVGFALETGVKLAVGAAITAVAGTAGAPVLLVTVASIGIAKGIDEGFRYLKFNDKQKSLTEYVSDGILDNAGAYIDEKVASAKNAGKIICSWFNKLSYA